MLAQQDLAAPSRLHHLRTRRDRSHHRVKPYTTSWQRSLHNGASSAVVNWSVQCAPTDACSSVWWCAVLAKLRVGHNAMVNCSG